MTNEIDIYNIPAFKRKGALAKKAKKSKSAVRKSRPKKIITIADMNSDIPADFIDSISGLNREKQSDVSLFSSKARTTKAVREMKECGICEGFFEKISVAVLNLSSPLKIGDQVILEKEGGLFEQKINSIQVNGRDVKVAYSGSKIGIKVEITPTVGTIFYKVV